MVNKDGEGWRRSWGFDGTSESFRAKAKKTRKNTHAFQSVVPVLRKNLRQEADAQEKERR